MPEPTYHRHDGVRLLRYFVAVTEELNFVADHQGWGNVMYIPAAPWCQRNERYAPSVRETFLTGSSPSDFPDERYEHTWANRFGVQDLNDTGRRGLGFEQPR